MRKYFVAFLMLEGRYKIAICYSCIFSGIDLLIRHFKLWHRLSLMTSKLGSELSLFQGDGWQNRYEIWKLLVMEEDIFLPNGSAVHEIASYPKGSVLICLCNPDFWSQNPFLVNRTREIIPSPVSVIEMYWFSWRVWPLGKQKWVSCRSGCDLSVTARDSGLPQRDRQPGWQLLTMTTIMPSDTGMEDSRVGWAHTQLTAWCHGLCLNLRGHTVFWANLSPEACTDSQHSHIKRMLRSWRPWLLTWPCLTGWKVTSKAVRGFQPQLANRGLDESLAKYFTRPNQVLEKYYNAAHQWMEEEMEIVQQLELSEHKPSLFMGSLQVLCMAFTNMTLS